MKIELIEDCTVSNVQQKKGQKLQVQPDLGQRLIDEKKAKSTEYETYREKEAEKVSETNIVDILEELPDDARSLARKCKTLVNIHVLEFLATDSRVTVRKAAIKRLDEIN